MSELGVWFVCGWPLAAVGAFWCAEKLLKRWGRR